jgi:hypothetical protein
MTSPIPVSVTAPPPIPPAQASPAVADPSPAVAEPLALRPHHREFFEVARLHLEKTHGKCPPTDDLMRLWLATATPWGVIREFEEAILNLSGVGNDLAPEHDIHYDMRVLDL